MYRGTTPTIQINVDVDLRTAEALYVTFTQGNETIFEKDLTDVGVYEDKIVFTLSQVDTLMLSRTEPYMLAPVYFQIRAKMPDGSALASNILKTTVQKILKNGVI